jgi:hypothetical protein
MISSYGYRVKKAAEYLLETLDQHEIPDASLARTRLGLRIKYPEDYSYECPDEQILATMLEEMKH